MIHKGGFIQSFDRIQEYIDTIFHIRGTCAYLSSFKVGHITYRVISVFSPYVIYGISCHFDGRVTVTGCEVNKGEQIAFDVVVFLCSLGVYPHIYIRPLYLYQGVIAS